MILKLSTIHVAEFQYTESLDRCSLKCESKSVYQSVLVMYEIFQKIDETHLRWNIV